jgi:hypothetical protein
MPRHSGKRQSGSGNSGCPKSNRGHPRRDVPEKFKVPSDPWCNSFASLPACIGTKLGNRNLRLASLSSLSSGRRFFLPPPGHPLLSLRALRLVDRRLTPAGPGNSLRPFVRLHRFGSCELHRGRVKTPGLHLRFHRDLSCCPFGLWILLLPTPFGLGYCDLPIARCGYPDHDPHAVLTLPLPSRPVTGLPSCHILRDRRAQRILSVQSSS